MLIASTVKEVEGDFFFAGAHMSHIGVYLY